MNNNFQQRESILETITPKPGTVISCKLIKITNSHVILDTGLKSDTLVPKSEFHNTELNIGESYDCQILSLDDGRGNIVVSRVKALYKQTIDQIAICLQEGKTIKGKIMRQVKGGYSVLINGINAFLPGSLTNFNTEHGYPEGDLDFSIVNLDKERNNVVLSHILQAAKHDQDQQDLLLEQLKVGDIRSGVIKNLASFGAFVNIGFMDGLVYIADISWNRIGHPSEVLKIGDAVQVKVLSIKDKRIFLGIKQLIEDPWIRVVNALEKDKEYTGSITNITNYGCFVSLDDHDHIEGLIHASELHWINKHKSLNELYKVGDKIKIKVNSVDYDLRRIAFSAKKCLVNPWLALQQQYKIGDIIQGVLTTKAEFGFFVNIQEDIDGLIHSSKINPIDNPYYNVGDTVDVEIISIDPNRQRIELKLHNSLFQAYESYVKSNMTNLLSCKIMSKQSNGDILVRLPDTRFTGVIPNNKLAAKLKRTSDDDLIDMTVNAVLYAYNDNVAMLSTIEHQTQKEDITATQIKKVTLGNLIKQTISQQEDDKEDEESVA